MFKVGQKVKFRSAQELIDDNWSIEAARKWAGRTRIVTKVIDDFTIGVTPSDGYCAVMNRDVIPVSEQLQVGFMTND
jgi:hypothetical protein